MSNHISEQIDLLASLSLPDRYERLKDHLGAELANILVPPSIQEKKSLQYIAQEIQTRGEGVLLPLYGETGTGKTTLASNLWQWEPEYFAPTLDYEGPIEYDRLSEAVSERVESSPANESRILPINLDHRESDPPNQAELASI